MRDNIPIVTRGSQERANLAEAGPSRAELCFFHGHPARASELGRIGGSKRRGPGIENTEVLAAVENDIDVKNLVSRLIVDVLTDKVNHEVLHPGFTFLATGLIFGLMAAPAERRGRRRKWSLRACVLLLLPLCAGCGGSATAGSSPASQPGTPQGIYMLNITGGSGNTNHSTTITLTVQ